MSCARVGRCREVTTRSMRCLTCAVCVGKINTRMQNGVPVPKVQTACIEVESGRVFNGGLWA